MDLHTNGNRIILVNEQNAAMGVFLFEFWDKAAHLEKSSIGAAITQNELQRIYGEFAPLVCNDGRRNGELNRDKIARI